MLELVLKPNRKLSKLALNGLLLLLSLSVILTAICARGERLKIEPSGERAYQHVLYLSQVIGERVGGTSKNHAAVDYIKGELLSYGYLTETQEFSFTYFETRESKVALLRPERVEIKANALIYSSSTPPEGLSGELAYGELGRKEDLQKRLEGKIALFKRGEIPFREKVENAASFGVIAVIVFNNRPGNVVGTLVRPSMVPAVTISQEDGEMILSLLEKSKVVLQIKLSTFVETRPSWNVIGTKKGREERRTLIIGAHHDSVSGSPGADDNASGVAVMLEVARTLSPVELPFNLKFVAFGVEEFGLVGSRHFASLLSKEETMGMVNIDTVGVGDELLIGCSPGRDDSLVQGSLTIAKQLGIKASKYNALSSDHVPFEGRGIPVVSYYWSSNPHIHTPQDSAERIKVDNLKITAKLITEFIYNLASPYILPILFK